MKFSQMEYQRLDMHQVEKEFENYLLAFRAATSFDEQDVLMIQLNELRLKVETMMELGRIRHSVNTEDPFYKEEQNYLDEVSPLYQGIITRYYEAVTRSPFQAGQSADAHRQKARFR
jgi:hypothetical protein